MKLFECVVYGIIIFVLLVVVVIVWVLDGLMISVCSNFEGIVNVLCCKVMFLYVMVSVLLKLKYCGF